MRALFVGGTVDNSELEFGTREEAPVHYPENTGSGQSRYRLHHEHRADGKVVYAVYAAPDLAESEVERVMEERDYIRRFGG